MIKFFRRIRQQLLNSGEMKKYSFYAIGEILLVVIGILIALQINNWNEQNKLKLLEKSTLVEINESLNSDILWLENQIVSQTHYWKKIKELVDLLQTNQPYTATIDTLLVFPLRSFRLHLSSSAFELLENRGIDLISNEDLRKSIVTHFKMEQIDIIKRTEAWEVIRNQDIEFFFNYYDPVLDQSYLENYVLNEEYFKILDYEKFQSDPLVVTKFKHRIARKIREIGLTKLFIEKKKALQKLIDQEINK